MSNGVCEGVGHPLFTFIKDGKWAPARTDDYAADNQTGREIARETEQVLTSSGNPALFGTVIRAIAMGGEFGAVEIGFCSYFGIVLAGLA